MTPTTPKDLFDAAFLRSLNGLRLIAHRVPAGGRHGEQRSRQQGSGVEFTDVRQYIPGDDYRAIDWNLWQRFGKLFLRLFLEDQDLPIHFLLDQSASMGHIEVDGTTKTRTARQAVAAMSYIALNHMDRVAVHPFAGKPLRPLPGVGGKRSFQRLLGYLAELPTTGETSLVDAVRHFAHRRTRRGLCVIVSDFFDPRGADDIISTCSLIKHKLLLLRPTHPNEESPPLDGSLQVVDCESGEELSLTLDEGARERYREAYRQFTAQLEGFARSRGALMMPMYTNEPTVAQLARAFTTGALTV